MRPRRLLARENLRRSLLTRGNILARVLELYPRSIWGDLPQSIIKNRGRLRATISLGKFFDSKTSTTVPLVIKIRFNQETQKFEFLDVWQNIVIGGDSEITVFKRAQTLGIPIPKYFGIVNTNLSSEYDAKQSEKYGI